jgi:DHA1 family multidrug resistance protein-like MFS transporter/DHA1 family quinolone resistance protein-like MFS transporter
MEFTKEKVDTLQFWVLNVASFVAQLSIAMVNLAMVYHLRGVFRLTADKIGIAASISTGSYLLFCILLSSYTVHFKPRNLVEISLLGMAASVGFFASTANLGVAYVCLAFYGALMSLLWPQIEGWFSRGKEGSQLSRVSNAFNFSWSSGVGVSSFVAGILVERSTTLPFFVSIALFLLVFLMIATSSALVPGIRAMKSEKEENRTSDKIDESTPLRFYCWIGVIILYTGMSVILTIFPLYAQDVLLISESFTGLLLLFRGVATCISFLLLGKFGFWHFKKRYIFLVQSLFALSCLVLTGFSSMVAYGLFFFLFGILFATAYAQSMFHGASGSINRSQRMIVHEVLLTVGTIIGAVLGGYLYELFSFSLVLMAIGIGTLVVVLFELSVAFARSKRAVIA